MSKKTKGKKIVFCEKIKCPNCAEKLVIEKTKFVVKPAVSAEYDEKLSVRKDSQTTLENRGG